MVEHHYRDAQDHLQRALDAALAADDLLLVANIGYPLDLVSEAILLNERRIVASTCA